MKRISKNVCNNINKQDKEPRYRSNVLVLLIKFVIVSKGLIGNSTLFCQTTQKVFLIPRKCFSKHKFQYGKTLTHYISIYKAAFSYIHFIFSIVLRLIPILAKVYTTASHNIIIICCI